MSDIQRYFVHRNHFFIYKAHENQTEIVKYDDHIAEVEKLKKSNKRKRAKIKAMEKSSMRMLRTVTEHSKKLQARIDELESRMYSSVHKPHNQVKAEGIEEAVAKFKKENEIWRWLPDARDTVNEIMEYANKLRSEG